jgi:hypothetical protein
MGPSSKGDKLRVILTHDIDWPPAGPGLEHIVARRERFEPEVIERAIREGFNPYNNIGPIMDLERESGIRSTFFFRPLYDDGTPVAAYSETIRKLLAGGWEVGAHLNDASSFESVRREREQVGAVSGSLPQGCRVHYLRLAKESHAFMSRAGFDYDSSLMGRKDEVTPENAGFHHEKGLYVFPITIMDAYLFTYMKVSEEKVPGVFEAAIASCHGRGYMTVLWHDNSILMKGGKAYPSICRLLASRDDIECITGAQACRLVAKEPPQ